MSELGHFRPIDGIRAMSAQPPTPVKLMQRSEGRNGPISDIAVPHSITSLWKRSG